MKDNVKTFGFSFAIQLLLDYWQTGVAWEALKRVSKRSRDEAAKDAHQPERYRISGSGKAEGNKNTRHTG
jgi:hypothetical protein